MLIIGHRGAPSEVTENTMASFAAAIDAGADGIETDVRLTTDGALVLSHDDVQGHGGRISEMTSAELRGSGDVVLLEDLLGAFAARTTLYLECKGLFEIGRFASAEPVASAVLDLITGIPDVTISSFDPTAVAAVRARAPHIPVGLGCAEMFPVTGAIESAAAAGYEQVHPSHPALDRDVVEAAVRSGVQLIAWTVNDPARAIELRELGVAGVFTDDPRGLRAAGV